MQSITLPRQLTPGQHIKKLSGKLGKELLTMAPSNPKFEQPSDLRRQAHTRPHKSSKIMFFFYISIYKCTNHTFYLFKIYFLIQLFIPEYTTHYNIYYSHYFIKIFLPHEKQTFWYSTYYTNLLTHLLTHYH